MPKKRSWTDNQLIEAVTRCKSYRSVLIELKLIPAGGNYDQIKRRVKELQISTDHFTGKGWNVGGMFIPRPAPPVEILLVENSDVQSYKLKAKLFAKDLKKPKCELCGWAEEAPDGRIPVELDHVNGVRRDNRLENLRILCPNCHSLQPTHRGKNKKVSLSNLIAAE
ncbi:HNH endonuclease [Candidatus Saccharibacteria bacterium]|nr:HNH endonuclease [Candidatus Saccharibacteria bacterium]